MTSMRKGFAMLAATGLAMTAAPALAQLESGEEPAPACRIIERSFEEGAPSQLVASCRGHGFILGPADSYEVHQNPALEATIIDLVWGGERRVIMISFPGEEPLLEDITATLARSAGRGALASLDGVAVDFSSFAQDGKIAASDAAASKSGEVNAGLQIAAEQARAAVTRAPVAEPAAEPAPGEL